MKERVSKGNVETAVERLNGAAKALGMDRSFRLWFGSAINGVPHSLSETHPRLAHPTETPIGKTWGEALAYLNAMRHALESAKRDRDYRADDAKAGAVSGISIFEKRAEPLADPGMVRAFQRPAGFDPDARSVTRADHTFG
jgi:hypothetical protein